MGHRNPILKGHKMKTLIAALMLTAAPALAETALPGFAELDLPRTDGPALEAVIWYPATGGHETAFAKNPVFTGITGFAGAAPLPGQRPLVLLSHGLGGHYRSLGWLAAGLAERGAVVVAVNHPGSTFGDMEMPRGMDHWTRVDDLSAAMAAVMADPAYATMVDPAQISAVGFSYGGWTALSAGGLQGNVAGYAAHCAEKRDASTHCADLARWGFDFAAADPATWDASYRRPEVSRVVAIDAGLTYGITDVSSLDVPALLIGLGSGADRLVATDTTDQGSGLASRLLAARPDAKVIDIAPAAHFTMLPECSAKGAAILEDEGDDPVCTDPLGTDRGAVHDKVVAEVAGFLGL